MRPADCYLNFVLERSMLLLGVALLLWVVVYFACLHIVPSHVATRSTKHLDRSGELTFIQPVKDVTYTFTVGSLESSLSALIKQAHSLKAFPLELNHSLTPSPPLPLSPPNNTAETFFYLPYYQFFRSAATLAITASKDLQQEFTYSLQLPPDETGSPINAILRADSPTFKEREDIKKVIQYFTSHDFNWESGSREGDASKIFNRICRDQNSVLKERKMSLRDGTISWRDMTAIISQVMMTRHEWLDERRYPPFTLSQIVSSKNLEDPEEEGCYYPEEQIEELDTEDTGDSVLTPEDSHNLSDNLSSPSLTRTSNLKPDIFDDPEFEARFSAWKEDGLFRESGSSSSCHKTDVPSPSLTPESERETAEGYQDGSTASTFGSPDYAFTFGAPSPADPKVSENTPSSSAANFVPPDFRFTFRAPSPPVPQAAHDVPHSFPSSSIQDDIFYKSTASFFATSTSDGYFSQPKSSFPSYAPSAPRSSATASRQPSHISFLPSNDWARDRLISMIEQGHLVLKGEESGAPFHFLSFVEDIEIGVYVAPV